MRRSLTQRLSSHAFALPAVLAALLYALLSLALALPVLAVLASWLQWSPQSADILLAMEIGRASCRERVSSPV